MYVCTPQGRAEYIHFPNRATYYKIQGHSCLFRPSVRHKNTSHYLLQYPLTNNTKISILQTSEDVAIATKYQNFMEHSLALQSKNSYYILKKFFGYPTNFSHYIEPLCSLSCPKGANIGKTFSHMITTKFSILFL